MAMYMEVMGVPKETPYLDDAQNSNWLEAFYLSTPTISLHEHINIQNDYFTFHNCNFQIICF